MTGWIMIAVSALFLFLGIKCSMAFNELDEHVPFYEVSMLDYIMTALSACMAIPFSIFGMLAGFIVLLRT